MTGQTGAVAAARRRAAAAAVTLFGFDTDTDGFTVNTGDHPNGSLARNTTSPYDGAGCLQVGNLWSSQNYIQARRSGPISMGGSTTLKLWARLPSAATAGYIQTIFQSGGFTKQDTGPTLNLTPGVWQQYQFTPATMPATLDILYLTISCTQAGSDPVLVDLITRS